MVSKKIQIVTRLYLLLLAGSEANILDSGNGHLEILSSQSYL